VSSGARRHRSGVDLDQQKAPLPFSKTLIAARLAMKKETLSRLLRQFTDQDLIAVSRGEVSVLDRDRLTKLAGTDRTL
jgi:CRP-like cAMP-binding protein